jgi:hypothetical protein
MNTILHDRELSDLIERIESDYADLLDVVMNEEDPVIWRGYLLDVLDTLGAVAGYLLQERERSRKVA